MVIITSFDLLTCRLVDLQTIFDKYNKLNILKI